MKKVCNDLISGCDYNCICCNVPKIEPEDCEYCREDSEESGVEYEADFTYRTGTWTCENCGRPV
jgi:hypothetical protein